jgi:hypothetical protein
MEFESVVPSFIWDIRQGEKIFRMSLALQYGVPRMNRTVHSRNNVPDNAACLLALRHATIHCL